MESAGLYGHSLIHLLDTKDFTVKKTTYLGTEYFAEGCAIVID